MRVRREMADALEDRDRKVGHWNLERETLADQPGEFRLVFERVNARHDSARTVPEEIDGQARLPRLRERYHGGDIAHVVGELVNVKAFAVGAAPTPQIQGVHRQADGGALLPDRLILTAVSVEAVADHHDRARGAVRTPRPYEDIETTRPGNRLFSSRGRTNRCHRTLPSQRTL